MQKWLAPQAESQAWKGLGLVSFSAVAILKLLMLYVQGPFICIFHWAPLFQSRSRAQANMLRRKSKPLLLTYQVLPHWSLLL